MDKVCGNGAATWDKAVHDASEEYKCRPVRLLSLAFSYELINTFLDCVYGRPSVPK